MDGWMDGWMNRWVGGEAGLRIAYSNKKLGTKPFCALGQIFAKLFEAFKFGVRL